MTDLYQLWCYVPDSHLDAVKASLFAAGAGRLGDYEACAWQVLGTGQFRPLPGSTPFIGSSGALETVPEWRIELVCAAEYLAATVAALRQTHPYEEPAFGVVRLENV